MKISWIYEKQISEDLYLQFSTKSVIKHPKFWVEIFQKIKKSRGDR